MKLKKYLKTINKMVEKDPSILELNLITASDDEGNSYNKVHYSPSIGVLDEDGGFVPESSEDFGDEYDYKRRDINSICIN